MGSDDLHKKSKKITLDEYKPKSGRKGPPIDKLLIVCEGELPGSPWRFPAFARYPLARRGFVCWKSSHTGRLIQRKQAQAVTDSTSLPPFVTNKNQTLNDSSFFSIDMFFKRT